MISFSEIVREDIIDEETEKRKGFLVKAFPTRLVFLQSDKSLNLLDLESFKGTEVAAVKFGYSGLHVEYMPKAKKIQVYTNKRQGQVRTVQVFEMPLDN